MDKEKINFSSYMLTTAADCVIVPTTHPSWSALLRRHCEGELISPDGRSWRLQATFSLNGLRKSFPHLFPQGPPWNFQPWPEDMDLVLARGEA